MEEVGVVLNPEGMREGMREMDDFFAANIRPGRCLPLLVGPAPFGRGKGPVSDRA